MMSAVACASTPRITVVIGGCHGADSYAMVPENNNLLWFYDALCGGSLFLNTTPTLKHSRSRKKEISNCPYRVRQCHLHTDCMLNSEHVNLAAFVSWKLMGFFWWPFPVCQCGRAFDPNFLFLWPNARVSVVAPGCADALVHEAEEATQLDKK